MSFLDKLRPGQRFTGQILKDIVTEAGRAPIAGRGMRVESYGPGATTIQMTKRRILAPGGGEGAFVGYIVEVEGAGKINNTRYRVASLDDEVLPPTGQAGGAGGWMEPVDRRFDPAEVDHLPREVDELIQLFPMAPLPLEAPGTSTGGCLKADGSCDVGSGADCSIADGFFLGIGIPCALLVADEWVKITECPSGGKPAVGPPPPVLRPVVELSIDTWPFVEEQLPDPPDVLPRSVTRTGRAAKPS